MSVFTPEQEQTIRYITRDEVRKIMDAGLMMTATTRPVGAGEAKPFSNSQNTSKSPNASTAPSPGNGLHWQQMPPPQSKPENGPWEKCTMLEHPELQALIAKLDGNKFPQQINGHKCWLLHDIETNAINGVGRRASKQ